MVQTFRLPSLTVTAMQASSRQQAGNIICDAAWAKVTIRLVADMNPERVEKALKAHLEKHVPWGLEVKFKTEACNPAWSESAKNLAGPVYAAADRALTAGYGKPVIQMGMGGSIPFVGPFGQALGGAPALLIGVEDPYTNAHGENESLLLSDFQKACVSQVHLFAELAEHFRKS